MKRSRLIAGVVAIGLGLGIWAAATAQDYSRSRTATATGYAAAPAPARSATQSGPEFNGKLVVLSTRGANQPKILEKAQFEDIHGRRFVVGQEVKATFSFPLGRQAHIAWDAVEAFYVFDNVAQYEAAMRQALEQAQGTVSQVLCDFFPGANCTINGPGFSSSATTSSSYPIPVRLAPLEPDGSHADPNVYYAPATQPQPAAQPFSTEPPAPRPAYIAPDRSPR
jgi:hypothetical protein